jgi:hypothetical protein
MADSNTNPSDPVQARLDQLRADVRSGKPAADPVQASPAEPTAEVGSGEPAPDPGEARQARLRAVQARLDQLRADVRSGKPAADPAQASPAEPTVEVDSGEPAPDPARLARLSADVGSGGDAADPGPVASFGKRDRLAEAPLVLRLLFDRWAAARFTSVPPLQGALARESAIDLIGMITQVLVYVRRQNGWSEDAVVPRDVASNAIDALFQPSSFATRLAFDSIFRTYPDADGEMNRAARAAALDVLSGELGL